jgi:hypothetical protein
MQLSKGMYGTPKSSNTKFIWIMRRIGFVVLYIIWSILLRRFKWSLGFLVYGTHKHRALLIPTWFEKYMRPVFPIGVIKRGKQWGWLIATLATEDEIEKDLQSKLQCLLRDVMSNFKLEVCALAGRLPGMIRRAGMELLPPFVAGLEGTKYTIRTAVKNAVRFTSTGQICSTTVVVMGGKGHTGSAVVRDLAQAGYRQVIGVDPNHGEPSQPLLGNEWYTNQVSFVKEADILVILTRNGDEAATAVPYVYPQLIVLDDSHPSMSRNVRQMFANCRLFKVTLRDGRLRMFPRLPGYGKHDIPGCLAEATVVLEQGSDSSINEETFNRAAEAIGLDAILEAHPDDM